MQIPEVCKQSKEYFFNGYKVLFSFKDSAKAVAIQRLNNSSKRLFDLNTFSLLTIILEVKAAILYHD